MVCLGFEPGDGRRRRNHGAIAATPPITFVYCFGLQNLRHHMCYRAVKNKWYRGHHTFSSVHSQLIATSLTRAFNGLFPIGS